MKKRSYKINDNAFNEITEDWQAYFLGLVASDGSIRDNQVKIKLHNKDSKILENLSLKLQLSRPLSQDGVAKVLYFSSKTISECLKVLGIKERKTYLSMSMPKIKSELIPAYIRGYFDGDGSISWRTARPGNVQINICSINKDFLIEIQSWFISQKIKATLSKEIRENKACKLPSKTELSYDCMNMYRLYISNYEDRKKFYELCWPEGTICIERKREIFTQYLNLQANYKKNKSRKYPWPEIYQRYIAGEEVPALAQEFGFCSRTLYTYMERNNLNCRKAPIGSNSN